VVRARRWWWKVVVVDGGGGGRMKEDEWNINRDAVDVDFKLRFPPEITLDIGARPPDNKIENMIILEIF
jgi:hypothetical protein